MFATLGIHWLRIQKKEQTKVSLVAVKALSETYQYETEWFLFNTSLGKGSAPLEWSKEQQHIPNSIAYGCRICGALWARIGVKSKKSTWLFYQRRCPAHGYGYMLDSDNNDARCFDIPYNVLVRELFLVLDNIDPTDDQGYSWQLVLDGK